MLKIPSQTVARMALVVDRAKLRLLGLMFRQ